MKYILTKSFTREFPLVHVQMWGRRYAGKFLNQEFLKIPIYVFSYKNGLATAYRNVVGQTQIFNTIIKNKIDQDPDFINHLVVEKSNELCELMRLKNKSAISKKEFIYFLDALFDYWQLHYIAQFLPLD